ncbi:hypothetical protein ABKZ63_005312 [Salmonella enterica]
MLKNIRLGHSYELFDDALIKGDVISDIRSIDQIREQAKKESDTLMNIARANCEKLSKKGFGDGYISGMNLAFTHLVDAIEQINSLMDIKQKLVLENVRCILNNVCEDPSVIVKVFESWVKKLPEPYENVIIHLPESLKEKGIDLEEILLRRSYENLIINYHNGDNIIMCSGKQYIAEFSPSFFSEQVTEELSTLITWTDTDARELTKQTLQKIIRDCSTYIDTGCWPILRQGEY